MDNLHVSSLLVGNVDSFPFVRRDALHLTPELLVEFAAALPPRDRATWLRSLAAAASELADDITLRDLEAAS